MCHFVEKRSGTSRFAPGLAGRLIYFSGSGSIDKECAICVYCISRAAYVNNFSVSTSS